jgi:hypothetical protein
VDIDDHQEVFSDDSLPLPARLDAAREMLRLLDETTKSIKQAVAREVQVTTLDPDLLATLYWMYHDIVPAGLLGGYHQIREMVEARCPWTYPCPACGKDQPVSSRSELQSLQRFANVKTPKPYQISRHVCRECAEARSARHDAAFMEAQEAHERRVRELRTMLYKDYLQTPEWQERRRIRLKAARYRCQVCNSNDRRLNVHHRTYERRGEELAADLIVLCEPCHYLFHRNGSLAPHEDGDH